MRLNPVLWTILLILCAGCGSGGAVVFAPTPAPPDLSPMRYRHPGGAFTIDVPRDWSVYTQNAGNLATASFSPPGVDKLLVTVSVIRLEETLEITELINQYQAAIRPDINRYAEQDRQAMGDGSWRISGLRQNLGNDLETVNTFIQQQGEFVAVVDSIVPENAPEVFADLETLVNTLQINTDSELIATPLETLSAVAHADLEITNVSRWFTPEGVFYVTGEVINRTGETISDIPVRVGLYAEDGRGIAEAVDTVMGYGIPPGGFAPFSLRFGQGQPEEVTEFVLTLGMGEVSDDVIYGGDMLSWSDSSSLNEEGQLIIEGEVTNVGEEPVDDLLAVVSVFDEARNVISARFEPLGDEPLEPEASRPYRILIGEYGDQPDNYIVNIQGR